MQRRRLSSKIKITVNVSRFIADQLTLACKDPSKNKSELTERALKLLLDPERDLSRDGGLQRRLDHLTRRVELIDRHQQVVIEDLGLFIQYFLTVTPPLPRSEQDAAKAKGHQRFEAFIAQLGRRIAGSHSLVSEVLEKVARNDPDLLLWDFDGHTVENRSTSQQSSHSSSPGPAGPVRGGEAPAPQRESDASSPPDAVPGASSQVTGGSVDSKITSFSDEATSRRRAMLKTAFGPAIAEALADPQVVEVMVNPDGRLWIDRLDTGRSDTGTVLQWSEAERIIRLIASHIRLEVHDRAPIVSAELPDSGERFEGLIPPVAPAPCFSIRKPAKRVHRLTDYVDQSIMPVQVADVLKEAVLAKANIIVVGGTSSGKTTLVNALLAEVAATLDRVVILEDTRELNCAAEDCVTLRTKPGLVSLADLVRSTMRLRPDRIIVGEVRGAEALDMLKAWNTGHPGGLATVHANSARGALYRIEQLVQESVVTVPRRLIAEAIDVLVFLEGRGASRKVTEVSKVEGLTLDGDYQVTPIFSRRNPLTTHRSPS